MTRARFSLFSPAGLMLLMAITRFHHFGSAAFLPDASLAVFFLTALFGGSRYLLLALLAEAGAIDYVAISYFNVSNFCVSTAYAMLIPAYAAMWWAGIYSRKFSVYNMAHAVKGLFTALAGSSVAFFISSAGFYWFSGRIAAPSWSAFFISNSDYYAAYVSAAMLYVMLIMATVWLWQAVASAKAIKAV